MLRIDVVPVTIPCLGAVNETKLCGVSGDSVHRVCRTSDVRFKVIY